ncbi:ABC transporter ATP-binding protein [Thalassobacillus sp. CUG 92003]|uniref:ABC transporter ATP-binding protein n=1 Tax=Thalassobacillus sp. CUG 92003 TaxID=2736641 RepID=UPI0015E7BB18|nr:ABC transporter ATP-binding protein [Thalassobacillus sp. CUG 92003]
MDSIITVSSLVKVFANQKALEDVNFNVGHGEIFGFLGPSGSGKTTTIKILTGQLHPTDGKAEVFGVPTSALNSPYYRKKFGVLTDNSGLYERLSIFDNLKLYCDLYDVPVRRIDEALDMVNLKAEQKKIVSKLSKGMLQRVLLARTLLHEPDLLFLDEPTAALDPANSQHIHEGLRQLNAKGTTIFLTTHDMQEAEDLCDRVALLNKGRVQLLDQPKALRRQFSDATVTVELRDGRAIILSTGPEAAETMHTHMVNNEVAAIYTNEPTLGDIFVEVTGRELI